MTGCIASTNGTIGYIDYGHGASAGLSEVRLKVGSDFRHSPDSVVAPAVTRSALPATANLDHANVSFLNAAGDTTWPIVQMTYVYVRQNVTFLENPQEQSLLIAFLRALYNDVYMARCRDDYGFTIMTNSSLPDLYSYAMAEIDQLESSASVDSTPWLFENKDTLKIIGAGPYVFSGRRHVQLKEIKAKLAELEETLMGTTASPSSTGNGVTADSLAKLQAQIDGLRSAVEDLDGQQEPSPVIDVAVAESVSFTESNQTQLKAAMALSSISFVLWMFWIAAYVVRCLKVDSSAA
jgi:hypothetical protein